jgi:putative peptide zinc metalloprotease protein
MMPTYSRDTLVTVRPFTRQIDGEEVIIGVVETGVFLAVPPEAVELLEYFSQGKNVGQVADFYQQRYGEVLDINDFLELLETKGIVESLDEGGARSANAQPARQQTQRVRYHFANFPQSLARRIFSRPVLAASFLLIGLALAAMIRNPSLVPRASDFYFPDHRALSWILLTAIAYAGIFVHEMGHLVAALALGINSRMGISNRLWYLVAETDLTGLWAVPKQKRYLPLLAGVLIDTVSGALLVLVLFALSQKWLTLPVFTVRMLRALMLSYWLRILWQFFLFVRTDFYFVIVSLLNCKNLLKDTEDFVRNMARRVVPSLRQVDQSAIPTPERRVIRLYSVLWLGGRIMAFVVLFSITVPVAISYIGSLNGVFRAGYSANPYNFVDCVVLSTAFLVPVIMGFMLWVNGLVRRERT